MKSITTVVIIGLLLSPTINGCAPAPQVRHEVIPVKQKQIIEANIIEGKTTKQEILDALGSPTRFSDNSLTYRNQKDTIYRIHLTQKDGTQLNFEISRERGGKPSMLIFFDYRKRIIVNSVSI